MKATYREALNQALREEMRRDDRVFLIGEDVAYYQGAFKVSKGFLEEFGSRRVVDTPITELGFTGLAIGAAMAGLRPVVEVMTFNFAILALDQMINNAAKWKYTYAGKTSVPIVVRGIIGKGWGQGPTHSQSIQSVFAHFPEDKGSIAAVCFNVKGPDLCFLDQPGKLEDRDVELYEKIAEVPPSNIAVERAPAA